MYNYICLNCYSADEVKDKIYQITASKSVFVPNGCFANIRI